LPWLTILGFASVGLGMAIVAPIAFSVGGRIGGDRPDHAISSIATMSYMAFLVGPGLIGFLAKASSLREAMTVVVVLALTIVVLAGFVRKS
jgi:MFS family permease